MKSFNDIKINIRRDNIFENVRKSLVYIYFLLFEYSMVIKSIAKIELEHQEFNYWQSK